MRDCIKTSRKILSQKSFQEYLGKEIRPGIDIQNDDELDEIIRSTAETAYHPSCSNMMGTDSMSVVDADTKVYGIGNLRIVDSSILPDIVSGNLNASTVMIAEKASDIILGKPEAEPVEVDFYKAA